MKRETVFKLIIALLILVNGVTLFFTFGRKKHLDMRTELVSILKLEGEEKEAVLALQKEHFEIKDQLMKANYYKYDSLFSLLKTNVMDTLKSNRLLQEIAQNHSKIEKMTFQHFTDVAKHCNKEQKALLYEAVFRVFDKNIPPHKHD